MKSSKLLLLLIYVLVDSDHCEAACEGSVTFYYTEKGEERIENMRNYGLLEEKLQEKRYKQLVDYFNPQNVYAYTMEGDCCWEIFAKEK